MQPDMAMFYQLAPAEVKQEFNFVIATTPKWSKQRKQGISKIMIREAQKYGGARAANEMRQILNETFGVDSVAI